METDSLSYRLFRDAFSDEITDLSESEGRIDVKGKGFRILVSE